VAEALSLEEAVRRATEANARYYSALGQLTVDYLRTLRQLADDLRLPVRLGDLRSMAARGTPARAPQRTRPEESPAVAAMVLEAEAGGSALGVFLVENDLDGPVSAPVAASAFTDEDGAEVRPPLAFEPAVVTLEPGQQMLVRVTAIIGEDLKADRSYRGELTIPGLTATPVPIVVRRRPDAAG